jgi:hypothetical protein
LDAREGSLDREVYFTQDGKQRFRDLFTPFRDWLFKQVRGPKAPLVEEHELNSVELNFLGGVWLEELARRSLIWCWNIFEGESNALWALYGSRGVAIHSTIGRVKKALVGAGPFRWLVGVIC